MIIGVTLKDLLQITALNIKTHIGVHAWEQKILQTILLDIEIKLNISACNDKLENTIDYFKLCESVNNHVASNSYTLIETLAEDVAKFIKNEFNLTEITISVSKPHAIKNAGNIKVTVIR